jgi:hypothetical protein
MRRIGIMQGVLFRESLSHEGTQSCFDKGITDVYTYTMRPQGLEKQSAAALFDLPCACQNLRRVTRVVTRIYDQELRKAGFEITQFGLLTALAVIGEAKSKAAERGLCHG